MAEAVPGKLIVDKAWPWMLAGALLYLSFGYTEMLGSDLWWHIAAGREIIQERSLWLLDDWSYTALGQPWRNHEWLADLIFYAWVSLFGIASLVYWKWLTLISAFLLLQHSLTCISGNKAAALVATALACALAAPFMDMRPQLYTLVGVAMVMCLSLGRQARLRGLLPLFLVWANLHGGFVFGLMLLGILSFPWRSPDASSIRRCLVIVLSCAAICLLNPDGFRVFSLPFTYALNSASPYRSLAEWVSPFVNGGISSPLYAYSLIVAAALALCWVLPGVRRKLSFRPDAVAFALLGGAMSATSRRFIILWAFAFALMLVPFAALALERCQRAAGLRFVPALLLIAAFGFGVYQQTPYPLRADVAYHYLTAEYVYPHALADFIETNDLEGQAFAYYNWGGYLHWRTDGAMKVFIDGRANTVFDDQTYLDYVSVLGFRPGWLERIENSGAQYVIWPHRRGSERLSRGLLQTRRWRRLYEDLRGVVLVRDTVALPATLRLPKGTIQSELAKSFIARRAGNYQMALDTAQSALKDIPWHHGACMETKRALVHLGDTARAADVVSDCRSWFPSRYLR